MSSCPPGAEAISRATGRAASAAGEPSSGTKILRAVICAYGFRAGLAEDAARSASRDQTAASRGTFVSATASTQRYPDGGSAVGACVRRRSNASDGGANNSVSSHPIDQEREARAIDYLPKMRGNARGTSRRRARSRGRDGCAPAAARTGRRGSRTPSGARLERHAAVVARVHHEGGDIHRGSFASRSRFRGRLADAHCHLAGRADPLQLVEPVRLLLRAARDELGREELAERPGSRCPSPGASACRHGGVLLELRGVLQAKPSTHWRRPHRG